MTGANGMIGRRVLEQLARQKMIRIRVLLRQQRSMPESIETVIGDLASDESLCRLLDGVDTVFHCAAELRDVAQMQAVNVAATVRLAQIAADLGVVQFIHLSSAGVIGPTCDAWVDEATPCHPGNGYEISKWQAEQALVPASQAMRLCMLRPTNVIDDDRPGVLALALRNSWLDGLQCFLKGGECAHLVHAEDVAAAAVFLAEHNSCEGAYFVGDDEDERNTVNGVFALARVYLTGSHGCRISLPAAFPYWLRRVVRGRSLHGKTRFSSKRLIASGFTFPLGLEATVERVCSYQLRRQ